MVTFGLFAQLIHFQYIPNYVDVLCVFWRNCSSEGTNAHTPSLSQTTDLLSANATTVPGFQ